MQAVKAPAHAPVPDPSTKFRLGRLSALALVVALAMNGGCDTERYEEDIVAEPEENLDPTDAPDIDPVGEPMVDGADAEIDPVGEPMVDDTTNAELDSEAMIEDNGIEDDGIEDDEGN